MFLFYVMSKQQIHRIEIINDRHHKRRRGGHDKKKNSYMVIHVREARESLHQSALGLLADVLVEHVLSASARAATSRPAAISSMRCVVRLADTAGEKAPHDLVERHFPLQQVNHFLVVVFHCDVKGVRVLIVKGVFPRTCRCNTSPLCAGQCFWIRQWEMLVCFHRADTLA